MVSGTFVLTDTIEKAFDSIFSSAYENTDAVVSGRKLLEWSASGKALVSPQVLDEVRALPEVESAAGTILDVSGDTNSAKILDREGEAIDNGNPTFGLGVDPGATSGSTRSSSSTAPGPPARTRSSSTRAPQTGRTSTVGDAIRDRRRRPGEARTR